jgi:hypothetical protein
MLIFELFTFRKKQTCLDTETDRLTDAVSKDVSTADLRLAQATRSDCFIRPLRIKFADPVRRINLSANVEGRSTKCVCYSTLTDEECATYSDSERSPPHIEMTQARSAQLTDPAVCIVKAKLT